MEKILNYSRLIVIISTLALTGCTKKAPISQVKIIWGKKDNTSFPETVLLKINFDQMIKTCGGTIVRDDLVLTAAHCIYLRENKKSPKKVSVIAGNKTFDTDRFFISPLYRETGAQTSAGKATRFDLGFLLFNRGTFSREKNFSIGKISQKAPKEGDKVSFIGYGLTHLNDVYSNRNEERYRGDNEIFHIYNDAESFVIAIKVTSYDHKKSCTNTGDSGGALFNSNGEIIGVSSSSLMPQVNVGNQWISDKDPAFSFFVNLNNQENKIFINNFMK